MKCQFCNQELPDGAKYCYKCNKQIVCLHCGKLLVDNAPICIYCGKEIKMRSTQAVVNHIKYSETETEKSFEASFSDETAGNVVDVFAQFIPIKRNQGSTQHQSLLQIPQSEEANVEEINDNAVKFINNPDKNEELNIINKIFTVKGDSIVLYEKRLKANSKADQQSRICLLFLLYHKVIALKEVTREDIKSILEKESLYDGNFRSWLSKHRSFFITTDNDTLELSPEGEEKAKEVLNEVFDKTIEGSWKPNGGSGQNTNAKVTSKRKNPQIVKNLNLMPKDKETLEDYMSHHKYANSSPQINLLFVYYLKQILGLDVINQDHIFTCYRHMKLAIPNNIYKSLSNTISRNGWLENISNLNVTTQGINEVEHKMRIK